ncbi:MAG: FHA domain-containing protein [Thermoguttaceae bacterium]
MKLELISDDPQKPDIVLGQFPVIVGLDPSADVCLDDSSLGHYQCMIDQNEGELMVWDLGTRSGTFINGVRIAQKASLRSGDVLSFGKHRFAIRCQGGVVRPRPAVAEARSPEASPVPPRLRHAAAAKA